MKWYNKLWQAIKNAFTADVKPSQGGVSGGGKSETTTPVFNPAGVNAEIIHGLFKMYADKLVGTKEIGQNTDNGGRIDKLILATGGRIGWPYCAMTVTYMTMQVCKNLGISYPKGLYRGASSQGFKNDTNSKYLLVKPLPWSAFVHTNIPLDGHGHTGFVVGAYEVDGLLTTFEGNFQQQINYFKKSTDYAKIYVDVVQAILDQYNLEKGQQLPQDNSAPSQLKSTPQVPNFTELAKVVQLDVDLNKNQYIAATCVKIMLNKTRYEIVESRTNVPWQLIAAIHFKEASLDFSTMLHNGEPLNIKSRIVPVGVGPFSTWEEAAVDALKREGCDKITDWSFAKQLEFAEAYNGKGFRKHNIYSPYVFSFTNLSNELGGYPRDHVWDDNYINKRPGVAAILLYLRR